MHEPPSDLPDATLRAWVRTRYALDGVELTFLPLGHDALVWVYRVRTSADERYFLKVRRGTPDEASLRIARALHDGGVAGVVAPLPTAQGALWAATAGEYTLALYPFVAGATGRERGLSARQWRDYGALLRQVHDAPITPALAGIMRRETFSPAGSAPIRRLDAHLAGQTFAEPVARDFAAFWAAQRETIGTLLARAEASGQRLARAAPPLILCHADIHTGNVLLDDDGRVWFVDWDEATLAPRERDLMFVVGGISATLVGPEEEAHFFAGYGPTAIEPLALAYYRYAWATGDIGAFGEEILFRPDLGALSRRAAFTLFTGLFKPGEIVALALASPERPT